MEKFNGFKSEEAHKEISEILNDIIDNSDEFPRDTIGVYGGDNMIELIIDEFNIIIWDCDVEIRLLKPTTIVDCGIMEIAYQIMNMLRNEELNIYDYLE
jgi:hypothetical protein